MAKEILLVEDSPDDVVLFTAALKKAGVLNPVSVVRDGAEALAYLKGEKPFRDRGIFPLPTVLFLDLRLPKVSGFEVLEWLQQCEESKKMLVVAISHLNEFKEVNRAYSLGARSFLTKPIEKLDLINLARHFEEHLILTESDHAG